MEASTCLEKMVGNSSVGVVLKDVSLEVHGGELMAVLGSKGILSYEIIISARYYAASRGSLIKQLTSAYNNRQLEPRGDRGVLRSSPFRFSIESAPAEEI